MNWNGAAPLYMYNMYIYMYSTVWCTIYTAFMIHPYIPHEPMVPHLPVNPLVLSHVHLREVLSSDIRQVSEQTSELQ